MFLGGGESRGNVHEMQGNWGRDGSKKGGWWIWLGQNTEQILRGWRPEEMLIRVAWINFLTYVECLREKWGLIFLPEPFFFHCDPDPPYAVGVRAVVGMLKQSYRRLASPWARSTLKDKSPLVLSLMYAILMYVLNPHNNWSCCWSHSLERELET